MRLRKQRGLGRSDFAPISSKEIARLESDEVAKPHKIERPTHSSRLEARGGHPIFKSVRMWVAPIHAVNLWLNAEWRSIGFPGSEIRLRL